MDTLVEDQSSANAASVEGATTSPIQTVVSRGGGQNGTVPSAGIVSASSLTPGTQVRGNGTILLMPRSTEKNVASTASTTTQAIAVPQPGGGVSIVHVSIPSGTQPMHVQSVIQPNQQSVIQAPTGTGLHSVIRKYFGDLIMRHTVYLDQILSLQHVLDKQLAICK
ncbi:uncharacterized protein LOC143235729 [Tachypleus tridentatus]|uniref:uncharacterized protein LOC143235729 n=1 Tax=Tachypleus tridentatus TaxID=6853 RepID=UPI003FD0D48B